MPLFRKQDIKRLWGFPLRQAISDEDYHSRSSFIDGTILGSGYEAKCWFRDYCPFSRAHRPDWPKLYERWIANGKKEWPCFDKPGKLEFVRDGVTVVESLDMPNEWAAGTGVDPTPEM